MPDVKLTDLPSLTSSLKGNSTTVIVQDGTTYRSTISSLSSSIYSNVLDNISSDVPVGTVIFYAASAAPVGWIECDGSVLLKSGTYSDLFSVIGDTYTITASSNHFKIPDLRGVFIRGWHHNKSGTADGDVDGIARIFGSLQQESIKNHQHDLQKVLIDKTAGSSTIAISGNSSNAGISSADTGYILGVSGVTETRPKNIALLPCIKYAAIKGSSTSIATPPSINPSLLASLTGIYVQKSGASKKGGPYRSIDIIGSGVKLSQDTTDTTKLILDFSDLDVTADESAVFLSKTGVIGFPQERTSYYNRMVITNKPSLLGWGSYGDGNWRQRIDPSTETIWPPKEFVFDENYLFNNPNLTFKKVINGRYHLFALLSDGTLWYNGYNYNDKRNGISSNDQPSRMFVKCSSIKFKDFTNSIDYSDGDLSIYALGEDGKLYTWGLNTAGQLGLNSDTIITAPTQVPVPSGEAGNIKQIEGAESDGTSSKLLVLYDNGNLYSCGFNNCGQLGVGDMANKLALTRCKKNSTTFVTDCDSIVTGICNNLYQSAYISTSGEVWTAGYNGNGHLGNGTNNNSSYFVKASTPTGVKITNVVSTGRYNTVSYLALDSDGKMYSWGYNGCGQLGHGNITNRSTPTLIDSMKTFKVDKIYGCDTSGTGGSYACIDVRNYAYECGYGVPAKENNFAISNKCQKFELMPIKNVHDIVLCSNTKDHVATLYLDKEGGVYSYGHAHWDSNGPSRQNWSRPSKLI